MPKMKITAPHELGQQEAAERMKVFLQKVKNRFQDQISDLQENWSDNCVDFSFKTYGFSIKGTATVEESQVVVAGDIPFAAMMFKGRIEKEVGDALAKALA